MKLLIALVLLVGCSGNEGKPIDQAAGSGSSTGSTVTTAGSGAGQFEAALVELDKYREKMCKCEDPACADTVFKEFTAWRAEFRKATKTSGAKPTPETEKKGNDLNKELMICRIKVTKGAGKGSGSAGSGSASSGSGSGSVAPADPVEAALVELDVFKVKMCGCPDKACADKLQIEYATWQRNLRAKLTEKPNKLQEVRGNALEKEMKECRKKAETATPGAPGGTSKIDAFLTTMQSYRDKMCACTTKDCATKMQKETDGWAATAAKDIADAKPTKDQDDKADRLAKEMKECYGRAK